MINELQQSREKVRSLMHKNETLKSLVEIHDINAKKEAKDKAEKNRVKNNVESGY
jgi:hypothetical protein